MFEILSVTEPVSKNKYQYISVKLTVPDTWYLSNRWTPHGFRPEVDMDYRYLGSRGYAVNIRFRRTIPEVLEAATAAPTL